MSNHVLSELQNGVLKLTLNRPEKKNALSNAMYESLCENLVHAQSNDDVRVILLSTNSQDFTSGNDLKDFAAVNDGTRGLDDLPVVRLLRLVVGLDKPLVSAVKGMAVGIGTTVLLHSDLVFAGKSSTFQMPFVPLGLVPEFASSYLLPLISGKARANLALMLGEPFDVNFAYEMGLISRIVDDETVEETALSYCRKLVALPPISVKATKWLITPEEERKRLHDVITRESIIFAEQLQSDEHREALSAFFEKRRPDFSKFVGRA